MQDVSCFHKSGHMSGKLFRSSCKFYQTCIFRQKVPHQISEVIQMETRSAFLEVCAPQLLLLQLFALCWLAKLSREAAVSMNRVGQKSTLLYCGL